MSMTRTLLPNALKPLNSSPPCPATLPSEGVVAPTDPMLIEDVIRDISLVRRTYSKAETDAPADLSSFSSSWMSSLEIELSGAER